MQRLHAADVELFDRLHGRPMPVLDVVLPPLSRAADHSLLWAAVAAALAATGHRSARRAALRGVVSIAAASFVTNVPAKLATRRTRPSLQFVPQHRQLRRQPVSTSFPSGHSASAVAFAVGVGLEVPAAAVPVAVAAAGVAFSRVHTGVHYPGDVLVGAVIGAGTAWGTTRVWPRRPDEPAAARPQVDAPALPDGAGLTVVVNSRSGTAAGVADAIGAALPAAEVVLAGPDDDLGELMRKAAAGGARALGAAGGDGTINCAAQVALDAGLPLAVFPAGTLNHFAGDLGVERIVDAAAAVTAGRAVSIEVGSVEFPDGTTRPFLNTASIGTYSDMVRRRDKLSPRLGKWPAVVFALERTLRVGAPVHVEVNGRERMLWQLFAGNGVYHPPGFAPSYRANLADARLDVRVVDGQHPMARVRLVAAVLTGQLGRSKVYEAWTTRKVRVRVLDGTVRLALDGELGDPVTGFTLGKMPEPLLVYRQM